MLFLLENPLSVLFLAKSYSLCVYLSTEASASTEPPLAPNADLGPHPSASTFHVYTSIFSYHMIV